MERSASVQEFIEKHEIWNGELNKLISILRKTELEETIKWGVPTYTLNGKNVVGLAAFKSYVGIWFFNGVFLKDSCRKLFNAQEGKTKALRQWRFESEDEMDEKLISEYINEAIANQKLGKEVQKGKNKELLIPPELKEILDSNAELKRLFQSFAKYKQREFAEYIASAKRETTKKARIEKIIPMLRSGIGLNDKYLRT